MKDYFKLLCLLAFVIMCDHGHLFISGSATFQFVSIYMTE